MPDYDFGSLSPIDFETLTRDLLQKNLGVRFESFGPGRDQGIDFRYSSASGQKWILQSKHYAKSGFNTLLSRLKSDEKPKVQKLKCSRYLLATSVSLTPAQKDRICAVFSFVRLDPSDIFGREDLNNLLSEFPEIEKLHFKLWFSSTSVFENILNSKTQNFTKDSLERIQESAKVYVQNDSLRAAISILDERRVCIICGIPGIGKTTLAEMLILHYLERDFEAVRISSDIEDAFAFEYHNTRRVFFYDDFLGRAVIGDKLNKNEDQRLLEFVRAMKKSKSSILIMTTREYILNQARRQYERLAAWVNDSNKCVIELSSYTRRAKSMILFNHIYFSDIPVSYKRALATHPDFLSLIDHKNYNPRLIEFMTDVSRLGSTPSSPLQKPIVHDFFLTGRRLFSTLPV